METMKVILIKSVFCIAIFAQEYSISIFGFHAADVSISPFDHPVYDVWLEKCYS